MQNENKNQGTKRLKKSTMEVTVICGIGPGFETITAFTQSVNKNSRSDPTYRNINGTKYPRMDQINLKKTAFKKFEGIICSVHINLQHEGYLMYW